MLESTTTRNRSQVGGRGMRPAGARRKEKQKEEQGRRRKMVQEEMVLSLQV